MDNQKRNLIIIIVLIIAFVFGSIFLAYESKQKGTITVNFSLATKAETNNISLKLNNKSYKVSDLSNTYTLHSSSYSMVVNKPGYKTYTANIDLKTGQIYVVNVNLQLSKPPTPLSIDQLSIPGGINNLQINKVSYFNDATWAVATIGLGNGGGDDGVLVAKYDAEKTSWNLVVGPGTSFNPNSTKSLPIQVSQFLVNNGFTGGN